MSRLPPISRGGIVRRPAFAAAGIAVSGTASATSAGIGERLLAAGDLVHQLQRRRDADDTGKGTARDDHARECGERARPSGDLPDHEEGLREEVGEEAEAGDDAVTPKSAVSYARNSMSMTSPGSAPST